MVPVVPNIDEIFTMSTKTTKCRIQQEDNEVLKLVALKLSAKNNKIVTTSEVLHAIIEQIGGKGERSVDGIINAIGNKFTAVG